MWESLSILLYKISYVSFIISQYYYCIRYDSDYIIFIRVYNTTLNWFGKLYISITLTQSCFA